MPNIEWCRDKGSLGARCAFTNTEQTRDISKAQWDAERFGQFCTTESSFAENQKFYEQACELVRDCDIQKIQKAYSDILKELRK